MIAPAPEYPFHHRTPIQMRFNDLDALGHVNNTIYLEYMDFAKVQYAEHVLHGLFDYEKESMVIVNINVEFYQVTHYGEPLEVLTRVDKVTEHTFTFEQRIINTSTQDVKVIARTVMIGFNIEKGVKMAVPSKWVKSFEAYEGRIF